MKPRTPPAPATWLLKHLGPQQNTEALAGDLVEEFRGGRSTAWYWRQVLAVIPWPRHLFGVVFVAGVAWYLARTSAHRPLATIIVTTVMWASVHLPGMLSTAWRIALGVAILTIGVLLFCYQPGFRDVYGIWVPMIAGNVVFYRGYQPPPSFKLTYRELLLGDPHAERTRLISQLERTLSEEADPLRRQAYAHSLAALRLKSRETRQGEKAP